LYDQLWQSRCVKVTAYANVNALEEQMGHTPINGIHNTSGGAARVFNTSNPVGCDASLLTPSPKFYKNFTKPNSTQIIKCLNCCGGGPFVMEYNASSKPPCQLKNGIETVNPYVNDKPLGNVLVIQERTIDVNDDDNKACPHDSPNGGYIMFEFCQPVTLQRGSFLSLQGNPSVEFRYESGLIDTFPLNDIGDNGFKEEDFYLKEVRSMKVIFSGKGSVAGINYIWCPTPEPTSSPTEDPTSAPTPGPTASPTNQPTAAPTLVPTAIPTGQPTTAPTPGPTKQPTLAPTSNPTANPTKQPTSAPTTNPTAIPTNQPTPGPTKQPTSVPTTNPTSSPTKNPTSAPTTNPTASPTKQPTSAPTRSPTSAPTP
jgi:hypothetical protein